jgi:hypothetical protein
MQETAQETNNSSLFTELTAEESASVNGGHYYGCYRPRRSRYYGCCRPRYVRRRNCGDYYRSVSYYNYDY